MRPILVLAYNRLECLQACVESILAQDHGDIFIHCDGAKNSSNPENLQVTLYIQKLFEDRLIKNYRVHSKNLGTLLGISYSIDWFFEHVNEGLIIEEDIVLVPWALQVAEILFQEMRSDSDSSAISLRNTVPEHELVEAGALFRYSRLISSHGWGTTAEKWKEFKFSLKNAENSLSRIDLKSMFGFFSSRAFIENVRKDLILELEQTGIANWDIRWSYTNLIFNWKILNVNHNLVNYIGYSKDSVHHKRFKLNKNLIHATSFPVSFNPPRFKGVDQHADRYRFHHEMHHTFVRFIVRSLKRHIKRLLPSITIHNY